MKRVLYAMLPPREPGIYPDVVCGDCGAWMRLTASSYGLRYVCRNAPKCSGTHGAHHANGHPLGVPANKATREARIRAHAAFDMLWRSGRLRRGDAYRWMRKAMRLYKRQAHIGLFDRGQCELLITLVQRDFPNLDTSAALSHARGSHQ